MQSSRAQTSQGERGSLTEFGQSPYARPQTTTRVTDKSSLLWKDFLTGIEKRKRMLQKLREVVSDEGATSNMLKRLLLELRQATLRVIEDALEIEYRTQLGGVQNRLPAKGAPNPINLPPLAGYKRLEDKEDVHALADMLTDVDELLTMPRLRVFLPTEFPISRNPFLLGKCVDELASVVPPQSQQGNLEDELKVLELLRYKRAAKALLRAEAQVINKIPITLYDVERVWGKTADDPHLDALVRAALTLLANNGLEFGTAPHMEYANGGALDLEPHQFLLFLNDFRGEKSTRIDVQSVVRQSLHQRPLELMTDPAAKYLVSWVNSVLSNGIMPYNRQGAMPHVHDHHDQHVGSWQSQQQQQQFRGQQVQPPLTSLRQPLISSESVHTSQATGRVGDLVSIVTSADKYGLKDLQVEKPKVIMKIQHPNRAKTKFEKPVYDDFQHGFQQGKSKSPQRTKAGNAKIAEEQQSNASSDPQERLDISAEIMRNVKLEVSRALNERSLLIGGSMSLDGTALAGLSDSKAADSTGTGTGKAAESKGGPGGHSKSRSGSLKPGDHASNASHASHHAGAHGRHHGKDHHHHGEAVDADTLSSVRYELLKIQQELIRRKVLDPTHYSALSVDVLNAEAQGLTTVGAAERHAKHLALQQSQVERHVPISEKEMIIEANGRKRALVVLLDLMTDSVLARVARVFKVDSSGEEIDPADLVKGTVVPSGKEGRETVAFMRISKLLIDRLTGYSVDTIMEMPARKRANTLAPLFQQMEQRVASAPSYRGKMVLHVDRVLLNTSLAGNGIAADICIKRNEECTGLIVECKPISGAAMGHISNGPITVQLGDQELQVLLINQRGLYTLSKNKWSGMESVAQWLSTRMSVRRIRLLDNETSANPPPILNPGGGITLRKQSTSSDFSDGSRDAASKTSGLTSRASDNNRSESVGGARPGSAGGSQIGGLLGEIMARADAKDPGSLAGLQGTLASTLPAIGISSNEANKKGVGAASALARTVPTPNPDSAVEKNPMLLDLTIDRKIEVPKTVITQWRSRKAPLISWMQVLIQARQDIEVMRVDVKLLIPHPRVYAHRQSKKKTTKDGLIDFAQVDEFSMDIVQEEVFNEKDYKPIEVALAYRLTSTEIAVFGAAELSDERNVALGKVAGEDHPSTFLWNVLTRMHVEFKGSAKDPYAIDCNAEDASNWSLHYDRNLMREVRSITGCVATVTVTAVGNELVFSAEPTDLDLFPSVGSKRMSEKEIVEIVNTESWPLHLLDPSHRTTLASRILDNLKIVNENYTHRLEHVSYLETRLLEVVYQVIVAGKEKDTSLGMVEINSHHTLYDLRVLIRHELDKDFVPKFYRIMYKGAPCADRQEGFRKAWECLPKCIIIPKQIKIDGVLTTVDGNGAPISDDSAVKHAEEKEQEAKLNEKKLKEMKLEKGQRRVSKRLIPVPVPTLAWVQEGKDEVHLLHDARQLLVLGDVIRIGDVNGRDYIIGLRSRVLMNKYPKTIKIEPYFDLTLEADFKPLRTHTAFPTPKAAGYCQGQKLLNTVSEWGFNFTIPEPEKPVIEDEDADHSKANVEGQSGEIALPAEGTVAGSRYSLLDDDDDDELSKTTKKSQNSQSLASKKEEKKEEGAVWTELWLWKCVPPIDDTRPKWLQLYDDGVIKYEYTYSDSKEYISHFRAQAPLRILEVLCTDCRCRDMTEYAQRIDEMAKLPTAYFTELAYKSMLLWYPQFNKGIEVSKFLKLLRESRVFPDFSKPARVNQLDLLFEKELRTGNGIADKYVNYAGFCHLLLEVALLRYPQKPDYEKHRQKRAQAAEGKGGGVGGFGGGDATAGGGDDDDDASVESQGSSSVITESSIHSKAHGGGGPHGEKHGNRDAHGGRVAVPGGKGKMVNRKAEMDKMAKDMLAKEAKKAAAKPKKGRLIKGFGKDYVLDPEHEEYAFSQLVTEYVANHSYWAKQPWEECKMVVMKQEAIRYCAASRIAAKFRGGRWHYRYTNCVRRVIRFQAHVRRRIATKRVRKIIDFLVEDWFFRLRYHSATKIISIVRRYLKRCWLIKVMKKRKAQEVAVQKARRFRFKKMRAKDKKAVIYKETRRMSGIMCLLQIKRKDTRSYSNDYAMVVSIYIPPHQLSVEFILEEKILRIYMQQELGVEVCSVGDLLDKRNLRRLLSSRLIVHQPKVAGKPPKLFFSKQSLSERGGKAMSIGKIISGELFVCRLFETGTEITVQSYHRLSCHVFKSSINMIALREWVTREYRVRNPDDDNDPPMLHLSRRKQLHAWALDHLVVDKRKGSFKVLFSIQAEKSKKMEMILKIQSQMRRCLVRPRMVKIFDKFMLKVRNSVNEPENVYYLDRRTGVSSWEKPKLLGTSDLPTEPSYRWVDFTYVHEDGDYPHYVNPFTGKYTHLNMEQAASIIQRLVRKHLLKVLRMDIPEMAKMITIRKNAKKEYESDKSRLACVINQALVAHVIEHDEALGKKMYHKALDLSDTNALVTRAYAIFLISTVEAPMKVTRKRGEQLLADADLRDPGQIKFRKARNYFRFACILDIQDVQALMNLALVEVLIFKDSARGERLLRRALGIAPFNERLVEIWKYLKDGFDERFHMFQPKSRLEIPKKGTKKRIVHGRPLLENPHWAGWCYVEEDIYFASKKFKDVPYWYNPADGTEQLEVPDFKKEWLARMQRSVFQETKNGMEQYWDPFTSYHFQYHPLTLTFM